MSTRTVLDWAARLASPQSTASLHGTIVNLGQSASPTGRAWFFADEFGELTPASVEDTDTPTWVSDIDLSCAPESGLVQSGPWQLVGIEADMMRLGVVAVEGPETSSPTGVVALSAHIAHALNSAANYAMMEDLVQQEMATAVAREAAIQLILDNMTEGLMVVNLEGEATEVRSAMVEKWLGAIPEDGSIWSWLAEGDPSLTASFEMNFDQITWDVLPFEVCASQMPERIQRGERTFGLRYTAVYEDDTFTSVVIAIADITAQLQAEADAEARREMEEIIAALIQNTRGFKDGVDELQRLVESVKEPESAVMRDRVLHTIKGNSAMLGFRRFSRLVHDLETALADGHAWDDNLRMRLEVAWVEAYTAISALISGGEDGITIYFEELERFQAVLRESSDSRQLERLIRSWTAPTVGSVFDRFGRVAQRLGTRFGRDIGIEMDGTKLRLVDEGHDSFLSTLVHVVRNAVDHGIEPPEERVAAGKLAEATIRLGAVDLGNALQFTIADDGRGIDIEKVRANAAKKGMPADAPLFDCLCAGSTKDVVTELSGRGVGMAALRDVLVEVGGAVDVQTEPGKGSTFIFTVPTMNSNMLDVRQAV